MQGFKGAGGGGGLRRLGDPDYLDFVKVVELMKSKAHLTKDGLEEIKQIKSGMNRGRDLDKTLGL